MSGPALVAAAAAPLVATARAVTDDQLAAPTPCPGWDVARLLCHLRYWQPVLAGAAKDAAAMPATSEDELELPAGDWGEAFTAGVDELVTAWSEPSAWEGTTRLGSPDPLPASMIGGMVVTELVLHGGDLARATGWPVQWEDRVVRFVHAELVNTAAMGREMGAYGPPVPVPDSAPLLDRALGLAGRDPAWRGRLG